MTLLKHVSKLYRRVRFERYIAAALVTQAVAGVTAFAIVGHISAASGRECGDVVDGVHNSISNDPDAGGGCGALTPSELIGDIEQGNPGDLRGVYSNFGLTPDKYSRFSENARMGTAERNGDVVVDGQTVLTDAWSIGRDKFSYGTPLNIGDGTYYKHMFTDNLKSDIPVMVMFDDDDNVDVAILTACGNPVKGKKVPVKKEKKEEVQKEIAKIIIAPKEEKVIKEEKQVQSVAVAKEKQVSKEEVAAAPVPAPAPAPVSAPAPVPAQTLPKTGASGAASLFFSTSLLGALGHGLYRAYKARK